MLIVYSICPLPIAPAGQAPGHRGDLARVVLSVLILITMTIAISN